MFNYDFIWGRYAKENRREKPSLDRIIPELGYIKGNVVFISNWANIIKQDATEKELYAVADWLHRKRKEVLNAFENTTPSVPTGSDQQGDADSKRRALFAARLREDRDDADHHSRTIPWQDADHRAEEGSGDGVGHGGEEMESSIVAQGIEATWPRKPEIIWLADRRGHLPDKP